MPIDRQALVNRHNPEARRIDPFSPFTVGNGELAFTADVTGLQTFPEAYEAGIPLCTQAQWGWHTAPFSSGEKRFDRGRLRLEEYDAGGRAVFYPTSSEGQEKAYRWLRMNPHRLHLGRIGLRLLKRNGGEAAPSDIADIRQRLILREGRLESEFSFEGERVTVKTLCHPDRDALSFSVFSTLVRQGRLAVVIAFPYGSPGKTAADWASDARHSTDIIPEENGRTGLRRALDDDRYSVALLHPEAACQRLAGRNTFLIAPSSRAERLELSALFSPGQVLAAAAPAHAETESACREYWRTYWDWGGMVELAGSIDPRAPELERRIVLSQYLTAVQCSGSLPPQETGLTCNSWYGKFHLEMHWWHAAHFALWGRAGLLERSLAWYREMLPRARAAAAAQGLSGARWPKMTDHSGEESPSPIGPLIIWQQPHPIHLAELVFRLKPGRETLARYRDIVFETAEFLASFAIHEPESDRYSLLPPLFPAQENHDPRLACNPPFELEQWHFALRTAGAWRERLGLRPEPHWDRVAARLALPPVKGGLYAAHERCPDTFEKFNFDHPSLLGACGLLPGARVDKAIMARTLKKVLQTWRFDKVWGWDFPLIAMTAARLGLGETAVDALFIDSPRNTWLPNGHNRQAQGGDLPVYLPGNGGLLAAVGMMAAGWDGCGPGPAPGFLDNGKWKVVCEQIVRMP